MSKKKAKPVAKKQPETPQPTAIKAEIPGQKQAKYLAAILCFICIALYANTIGNGYAVDDGAAIVKNKIVQQGVEGIPVLLKTGFLYGMYGLTSSKFSYRPVSLISFAIEHSLWGDNPHISHSINVLLFALTVVLLFYLLQKVLPAPKGQEKLRTIYAFVISALFAAHPIHTEVVAYIKSRDEIFSFLFLLLSMNYAVKYLETKKRQTIIKSAILFFLALMSKESAISFVAIIPFTLYYFMRQTGRQIRACALAMVVAMVAYLLLRISIFGDLIHSEEKFDLTDNFMQPMGFAVRLPVAIAIIGKYMLKLVFPHPLSFDYSYNMIPAYTYSSWEFIVSLLICLGLAAYAIYAFKKKNITVYAIIFFFISIAVVSNIAFVIGNAFAERFMFVPSLAFCMALVYGIMLFYKKDENMSLKNQPIPLLCLSGILFIYGIKTITRNNDWKDNYTLYEHDIEYADKSAKVHFLLGLSYLHLADNTNSEPFEKDMLSKAENQLETSLKIFPDEELVKKNLVDVELRKNEYSKANTLISQTNLPSDTTTALYYYNIANNSADNKNFLDAIAKFKMAISSNPQFAKAYINLGSAYLNMQFYDSAIDVFNKGISILPNVANGYEGLGVCYNRLKEYSKAIENYKRVLEFNPDDVNAMSGIGECSLQLKDYSSAIQYYNMALKYDPNIVEAYYNLAYIYHQQGNEAKARQYKQEGDELAVKMNNIGH